jgi:RNA polymerase sigma-70 factor (ECF subfamily)
MARYARGEREAFAVVYDAVAPPLYGYLLAQTRNVALAEDVLQQTFLQMHRAHGSFITGSPVMPWAFAIARRLLIDERRRGRHTVLSSAEDLERDAEHSVAPEGEELVAARTLAARLQQAFARLPGSQRAAFEALRLEGLSHSDAARALGITVSALKLRAHRAYVALRAIISEEGPASEGS